MDPRHFSLPLEALILSALLSGLNAALQYVPTSGAINWQAVLVTGVGTFVAVLLHGYKQLYQPSPGKTPVGYVEDLIPLLQDIGVQMLGHALAPKPTPAVPVKTDRGTQLMEQSAQGDAPQPPAVSTDVPTHP